MKNRAWAFCLAMLSGVLYFVGFCGFDQFYLSWVCLIPVLWALDDESLSGWETLAIAWCFGLVTHMGGYTWIAGMLNKFAYLPWPLAILGYMLLCLAQGSLLGAWGWVTNRLVTKLNCSIVWVAPVVMVVAEWIYPALFPSYLSNSQYRQLLFIQSLDIWGPLGLTFVLTLSSSVLYAVISRTLRVQGKIPAVALGVFGALVAFCFGYGASALASIDDRVANADRRVRVGMVQVSMGMYEKGQLRDEGVRRHQQQSLEAQRQGADLIIWPESGYYKRIIDGTLMKDGVQNLAGPVLGPITTPLLFGALRVAPRGDGTADLYNAAYLLDGDGYVQGTYDKIFLLAFGEYIPFGDWFPILYEMSPHSSHFTRGTHTRPLELDGLKYGVLICYEDILPGFVNKVMEGDPDILVNITNDSWFGDTREPLIHLALASFRAVEQRRFLARSTNTGISAIIDPAGRIIKPTDVFARANVVHDVVPLKGRTLYSRFGDWVGVICLLVTLWWCRHPLMKLAKREPPAKADATESDS